MNLTKAPKFAFLLMVPQNLLCETRHQEAGISDSLGLCMKTLGTLLTSKFSSSFSTFFTTLKQFYWCINEM